MSRQRLFQFAAAVVLLAAGYALAQGRDGEDYLAVASVKLVPGGSKTKDKYTRMPHLTEALNRLAEQGYAPFSVIPWEGHNRVLIIARRR